MWKERIQDRSGTCEFGPPASADRIEASETELGVRLPEELRSLLAELDGARGEFGLIWSVDRIVEENREFRRDEGLRDLYMPFDHLLFFGESGNGDRFAYPIHADGLIHRLDIFAWDHETDSRRWFAPSLRILLEGHPSGDNCSGSVSQA